MPTNRITIDVDRSFFRFLVSLLRSIILFRKIPIIRKTSKGFHLIIYLPYLISNTQMLKYRKLLLDDERRIMLDFSSRFKPKQVLFDEKIVTETINGRTTILKYSKPTYIYGRGST